MDILESLQYYVSSFLVDAGIVIVSSIVFAIVATIFGCLFAGIDRKISARMQGRIGPSILQPYYDVAKLFSKERVAINGSERVYVISALIFVFFAGGIFFSSIFYTWIDTYSQGGN